MRMKMDRASLFVWLLMFILSLLGPVIALYVIWGPEIEVTSIEAGASVEKTVIEQLRIIPDDSILKEINGFAAGRPGESDHPTVGNQSTPMTS